MVILVLVNPRGLDAGNDAAAAILGKNRRHANIFRLSMFIAESGDDFLQNTVVNFRLNDFAI